MFCSPVSIAITSPGEERGSFGAFRTFFSICACLVLSVSSFLGVWEGLRFVIMALPGLFSYLFFVLHTISHLYVQCPHFCTTI